MMQRTSGTEPKIKNYCELSSLESMLARIVQTAIDEGDEFLQPNANGLTST
jgi:phosphomannomutase